jgi:hypothetical protein
VLLVQRDRVQVVGDLGLLVADTLAAHQSREALLVGDLADDGPQAPASCHQTERERDRRLPHAPLAGDEYEPLCEEGRDRPQVM